MPIATTCSSWRCRAAVCLSHSRSPTRSGLLSTSSSFASLAGAVPVAATATCEEFKPEVDETVCAATPRMFNGVGRWYEDFSQTSDGEVHELLAQARTCVG